MTIPEDAFIICTNRLFVSMTVLTRYGPVNRIVSEFSSNDDLLEACLASSTLPYLTERRGCRMFRGEYVVDGGLTNNIPVFTDGVRRQLVFRLFDVEYPWRLLINAQGASDIFYIIQNMARRSFFISLLNFSKPFSSTLFLSIVCIRYLYRVSDTTRRHAHG